LGDLDSAFFFQYFHRFDRPFLYFFLSQPSLPPTVISATLLHWPMRWASWV
jgi:hypothetical protein